MKLSREKNLQSFAGAVSRQAANAMPSAAAAEINALLRLAHNGAEILRGIFPLIMLLCFALSALLAAGALIFMLQKMVASFSWLAICLTAIVPALLFAATVSHACGNFLIAKISGITPEARRGLALHLPANRAPRDWARFFRRWIYCGDWLVETPDAALIPYARAFVTGEPPRSIREELSLWRDLFHQVNSLGIAGAFEIGHSVCELAPLAQLPPWANEITPGMTLPEVERALGGAGHQWAINLLKRAAIRKKSFGKINFDGTLSEAIFEFHYCELRGDREALLVIIRPHLTTPICSARRHLASRKKPLNFHRELTR